MSSSVFGFNLGSNLRPKAPCRLKRRPYSLAEANLPEIRQSSWGLSFVSDFIPLSFVNGAYLPLLEAWRKLSDAALPQAPHIYCMDMEAFEHCEGDDRFKALKPPVFEDFSKLGMHRRLRYFWIRRFDVLEDYLKTGQSFIHTDLDAFWHKDITPIIESIDADIIISREFGMPKPAVNTWGFAVCCGLFAVRPTAASRALFAAWRAELPKTFHDQIALNTLLLDADIQWGDIPSTDLPNTDTLNTEYLHTYGTVEIAGEVVRVAVLNDATVARQGPAGDPARFPFVSHPFFERSQQKSCFKLYTAFCDIGLPRFDTDQREAALAGLNPQALKPREVQDYLALCWAISHGGADADWLVHRATLAAKAGNHKAAAVDLEAALEMQPGHSAGALALFDAYREVEDDAGQARMTMRLSHQHHADKLTQRAIAKRMALAKKPVAASLFASRALGLAAGERLAYWRELWSRN